jgi:hypothetical protein
MWPRKAPCAECLKLRDRLDHEQRMVGYLTAALQAKGDNRGMPEIIEWCRRATDIRPAKARA